MRVKIEPTGCCERKGLVQVRFSFYLDEGDYGYEKHHVRVPERELTEEEVADPKLAAKVKKVWQDNPFHNHFYFFDPDTSDKEIMDTGEALLQEAYKMWSKDEPPYIYNPPINFPGKKLDNSIRIAVKVQHLKEAALERVI